MMNGYAPPDVFSLTNAEKKTPLSEEGASPLIIIYEIQIDFNNLPASAHFTICQRKTDAKYILEIYRRFSGVFLPDHFLH